MSISIVEQKKRKRTCRGNSVLSHVNARARLLERRQKMPRDKTNGQFKKMTFVENYRFNSISILDSGEIYYG